MLTTTTPRPLTANRTRKYFENFIEKDIACILYLQRSLETADKVHVFYGHAIKVNLLISFELIKIFDMSLKEAKVEKMLKEEKCNQNKK